MDPLAATLPKLLGLAWLLPLASFTLIVLFGPRMGKAGHCAGYLATLAIVTSMVLSLVSLGLWLGEHPIVATATHSAEHAAEAEAVKTIAPVSGDWYLLGQFGSLRLTIGYYIDALTVAMFSMVTVVATCIHVYSFGYMHEELHEVTDRLAMLSDGKPLVRRGRFCRFYQFLSLFCFSMLGLVIAGNIAMVFVFWELVGICSYLLIGFYIERKSASNAANKAFIVNRVGDFGMLIGMMALWTSLGTFSFADYRDAQGQMQPGIFSQVRPANTGNSLIVPDRMIRQVAMEDPSLRTQLAAPGAPSAVAETVVSTKISQWRDEGMGYGLLVVAGLGIFCGCVGKSAQFPLHVWLPDAMEGPTPVSALIHAATMVAAGVYLVGRFYAVFTPEVLLVIAIVGCITLFLAATIALVATDIKRVLAYSTVSQLGYMMLALGVGGWVAGLFHLFNHAFFKALLFLGSGSVIHATGTNEMPKMGGLLKKMPWTAGTMLIGCLAIAGAGIPLVVGLSGYYSKDAILAQLFSFKLQNPSLGWLFYVAASGAGMTAFYMFRLWFLTFVGPPRDKHIHEHAHESPRTMWIPLVVLACFAVVSGWPVLGLTGLLEQARPVGTDVGVFDGHWLPGLRMPSEEHSHASAIHVPVSWVAFLVALAGFLLATAFYGLRSLDAADARRTFRPLFHLFRAKWWFDELYQVILVRPVLAIARFVADVDRKGIDFLADSLARGVRLISACDDWIDRLLVDGLVNLIAERTHATGLWLRTLQTGQLRQYVVLIVVGTVALFVLVSFCQTWGWAGQ